MDLHGGGHRFHDDAVDADDEAFVFGDVDAGRAALLPAAKGFGEVTEAVAFGHGVGVQVAGHEGREDADEEQTDIQFFGGVVGAGVEVAQLFAQFGKDIFR